MVHEIDPLLSSDSVRKIFGGVGRVTLARWICDDPRFKEKHPQIAALNFPKPDKVMAGRNYWKRSTIQKFIHAGDEQPDQGHKL